MPPTLQDPNGVVTVLFHHNTWANLKLLDFCESLNAEQLAATLPGTFGSILDMLVHVVHGEVSYVHRVNGKWPPVPPPGDEPPTFANLKTTAKWSGEEMLAMALSARPDTLVEETSDESSTVVKYPLASLMMQAIDHGIEHRTQIAAILVQLGLTPPDMSGWVYMEEEGEFKESPLAES